jgi:hypothetical protein
MLNNDRLSHWCVSAVLAWAAAFGLLGLPIFHLWLAVPINKIAVFSLLACALQLAFTPWLFSARATIQNPAGLLLRRGVAVIVWLSLLGLLFACFVLRDAPSDSGARAIFLGGPIVLGTVALIVLALISPKKKA